MKNIFLSFAAFFLFSFYSIAQDTHYWTCQYGPRGAILGNSIIGSVKDNSSIFYNPGFLALADSENISVSANIYQYDMLYIIDGAGKGFDLNSNQTQILPSLVSGTYQFKKGSDHKFGYAILTKNQTGIKTSSRSDTVLDVLPIYNNPGNEEFIGQFSLKSSLNEQWFGGCYSYKFNSHFSLGLSLFAAYRSQSKEYSYVARVIPPTLSDYSLFVTPIIAYNDVQSVEMTSVRGIGKIGLAMSFPRIDFGLTLTSPGLPFYGSTTIQRDELLSNLNADGNNFSDYTANATTYKDFVVASDSFRFNLYSYTTNDRQSSSTDNIQSTYKSPLSVAAGIVFKSKATDDLKIPKRKFYFSVEYFAPISNYYLIEPEERGVIRPLKDNYNYTSIQYMGITESVRSVVNFAVGYEQRISKRIRLLASFRTNNSYLDLNEPFSDMQLNDTFWNLWHYSIGAVYKKKRSDISLGFLYCDGFGLTDPYVVMSDPKENTFLQGENYTTYASFMSIAFCIGYTYYFKCADN
jgi:hypothetical protein